MRGSTHRVTTITGRRGFQPGGLVASGEIKKEGTHLSAKPQPLEVDTAKPPGKLSGHGPCAGRWGTI